MRTVLSPLAVAASFVATVLFSFVAAVPAAHAAEDPPPVTWAVSPASATAPDGRSWIESTLDPGETITEHLAVRNLGTTEVTFALTAADGYFTTTGRFNLLPSNEPSTGAGTWISLPASVTVGAGDMAIVPFEVTVPESATPGDHAAGVAASIVSLGSDESGAQVGVESRVGFRVMTRVTGEVNAALALDGLRADYRISWNPFQPGSATVHYTVENVGNVRMQFTDRLIVGDQTATSSAADASPLELLPGDRREGSITVSGVWPLVMIPATVQLDQSIVGLDGSLEELDPLTAEVSITALPLPQLLVALALALILIAIFAGRRRQARELDRRLDEAREEGRRAATVPTASTDPETSW